MEKRLALIKKDIKEAAPALICIGIYMAAVQLVFHRICPFLLLTGIPCPGCGVTRAFASLIKGDPETAITYNAMIFGWLLLGIYFLVCWDILMRKPVFMNVLLALVCVVAIVYYIYRMVYVYPSEPPMVYYENNIINNVFGLHGKVDAVVIL